MMIQRYANISARRMKPVDSGMWVSHADHIAQMAEARKIIEGLRGKMMMCHCAYCQPVRDAADKFLQETKP